jgi:hypothetical protein
MGEGAIVALPQLIPPSVLIDSARVQLPARIVYRRLGSAGAAGGNSSVPNSKRVRVRERQQEQLY